MNHLAAIDDLLSFAELRSARIVDPIERRWVAFVVPGRHVLVWAWELWVRDDPEAGVALDRLVEVFRQRGYAADWVTAPWERIRIRATTRQWPSRWYPADEAQLHERSSSRPAAQPGPDGAARMGADRPPDR